MPERKKAGRARGFNQLSENTKSALVFTAAMALICIIALWLR